LISEEVNRNRGECPRNTINYMIYTIKRIHVLKLVEGGAATEFPRVLQELAASNRTFWRWLGGVRSS
jgi:hypothetical protein